MHPIILSTNYYTIHLSFGDQTATTCLPWSISIHFFHASDEDTLSVVRVTDRWAKTHTPKTQKCPFIPDMSRFHFVFFVLFCFFFWRSAFVHIRQIRTASCQLSAWLANKKKRRRRRRVRVKRWWRVQSNTNWETSAPPPHPPQASLSFASHRQVQFLGVQRRWSGGQSWTSSSSSMLIMWNYFSSIYMSYTSQNRPPWKLIQTIKVGLRVFFLNLFSAWVGYPALRTNN